jgi:hypothetical protein
MDHIHRSAVSSSAPMTEQTSDNPDEIDTASTVRLPVRVSVLARIEAALLADKVSVSGARNRRQGKDPYNVLPAKRDSWSGHR